MCENLQSKDNVVEDKKQIDIAEIDWIVENLAFFFVDQSVMEPVAITRAMTVLLRYKYQLERDEPVH